MTLAPTQPATGDDRSWSGWSVGEPVASPAPVEDFLRMGLAPIGLPEVLAAAELQTRIDHKYIIDRSLFDRMVVEGCARFRCLTIDDRTVARYQSVYFDTAELDFFHQHLHGRRRRAKVRTRTYLDSGDSMLEVKTVGQRSLTIKDRLAWNDTAARWLGAGGDAFVASVLGTDHYRGLIAPSMENYYRRATLVDESAASRVTCDFDLVFQSERAERTVLDGRVLIETKSATGRCPTDRWLLAHGARPMSMSKYCIGIALLYPEVRANRWHRTLRRHFGWMPA